MGAFWYSNENRLLKQKHTNCCICKDRLVLSSIEIETKNISIIILSKNILFITLKSEKAPGLKFKPGRKFIRAVLPKKMILKS